MRLVYSLPLGSLYFKMDGNINIMLKKEQRECWDPLFPMFLLTAVEKTWKNGGSEELLA